VPQHPAAVHTPGRSGRERDAAARGRAGAARRRACWSPAKSCHVGPRLPSAAIANEVRSLGAEFAPDVTVVHFGTFSENGSMTEITVTEARARLSDVVDEARVGHDPVFLTRRGRRVAAVIDADDLQRLIEAAEDLADVEAARASRAEMAETGEAPIPWDQVKADLGLA
jgi:antitoxin Phd